MLACCLLAMVALASAETCPTSFGVTTCTIYDGNTTAVVNANFPNDSLNPLPGIVRWTVNGMDYLFQQWFWFRIGENPEETIDMLRFNGAATHDDHTSFEAVYGILDRDLLAVTLDFDINDGPSPTIDEEINITNLGFHDKDIHFFQYVDFDLSANNDDDARIVAPNQVVQTGDGIIASETVFGPNYPDAYEVNQYPVTLEKLTDNGPSVLSGQDWTDGDATWAFQWDFTLDGFGDTYTINKEKMLSAVPEPASILLLGTALLLASRLRRKAA